MLTLKQIAEEAQVTYRTVAEWARTSTPTRPQLRTVRLGHRTLRVRPVDWERFKRQAEERIPV